MKKALKAMLMAGIAIAVGVAAVYAAQDAIFEATDEGKVYTGWNDKDTALIRKGLFLRDNAAKGNDHEIRTYGGADEIMLGSGDDLLHFWAGQDAITFGGGSQGQDDSSAAITFDADGSGPATAFSSSKVYVRVDTPNTVSAMEVRADDVTVTANKGDVIIQLGK